MKHLEVRQKYSAARRIFNSLLGVSSGDETLRLMFDILLQIFLWNWFEVLQAKLVFRFLSLCITFITIIITTKTCFCQKRE